MSSSTSNNPPKASTRYDADFFDSDELRLIEQFEDRGYVIVDVDDVHALERIRSTTATLLSDATGTQAGEDVSSFLNNAGSILPIESLNRIRLQIFGGLNRYSWFRPSYYRSARESIHTLIGNELAMQRRVNLSIQLPNDDSSLLPVHSDAWSGDSPYELVAWLPLVDCHKTKSMFILPRSANSYHTSRLAEYRASGSEGVFAAIEADVEWLEIPVGKLLVFTHTLMHGNRINREAETRWSLNCRFKSLLSPYDTKGLGEFFEPITTRAATRLGLDYKPPTGFSK